MPVSCKCCILSGRRVCDKLIARPEESYQTVVSCCMRSRNLKKEAIARVGPQRHKKKWRTVQLCWYGNLKKRRILEGTLP